MPAGRQPVYVARVKQNGRWQTIGAAWEMNNQDGLSVKLNVIPVGFDGGIVLLPPSKKDKEE